MVLSHNPSIILPVYSFNHSRPVYGHANFTSVHDNSKSEIDSSIVEKKFVMWDEVVEKGYLQHKDPKVRARALLLLEDKTIMAYAQLRYDNQPIKMLPLQDAILSDKGRRVLFCGCNQHIGKSFTLNVDAATSFMMDHGKNWIEVIVSGSLDQSKFQMGRIKQLLKSSNVTYREEMTNHTKTGKEDNKTQISYTFYSEDGKTPIYTNKLICCPHNSSALGYPVNEMFLDEFDFWENCDQEHFLYQVAIPRTFQTKGTIKCYTNPDGRDKMMFQLWNQKDKFGKPAWHRYHFNYWDKPGCSQEEFDEMIIGMTKGRIESTLLAVFTRTEGSFFSSEEITDIRNDEDLVSKGVQAGYGRETVWFMDVGSVHDQSVLMGGYLEDNTEIEEIPLIKAFYIHKYPVGYPLGRVAGLDVDEDDGWEDYAEENPSVKEVLTDYAIEFEEGQGKEQPLFGYDATGNSGLKPLFQALDIDAFDITFSGKRKWEMYQRFQYYVQQRFIKRALEHDDNTVNGCSFDYQLSKLVVKKGTSTIYKQVHHENENDLDDCCDTMAGLIHLIENPDLPSLSFEIINNNPVQEKEEDDKTETEKELEGQYVPSWMNKGELNNWIANKEKRYT